MIIQDFDFKREYEIARRRATEMVGNDLYSRFGLSKEKRIEKALLGCLGELAFERLLVSKNLPYIVDRENYVDRNSDEFDFLMNGKKVDIKVAKKTTLNPPGDNWTYGYPKEQHPLQKDFVVVGWIDFTNESVGIYGWTTGIAIEKNAVVNFNSFKGYKYLTPNHEFKWGALNKNFDALFDKIFFPKCEP
ncbi:MAG: hypothetical protein ABIO82_02265 [Ginsengibacter sp.]